MSGRVRRVRRRAATGRRTNSPTMKQFPSVGRSRDDRQRSELSDGKRRTGWRQWDSAAGRDLRDLYLEDLVVDNELIHPTHELQIRFAQKDLTHVLTASETTPFPKLLHYQYTND